jgi:pterin-4a-carbinolamine dehydratase
MNDLLKNIIKKIFKFKTFVEAFTFMTAIAIEAGKLKHDHDWSISFICSLNKYKEVL